MQYNIFHLVFQVIYYSLHITMPGYQETSILGGHFMDMIIIQVWATILWDIVSIYYFQDIYYIVLHGLIFVPKQEISIFISFYIVFLSKSNDPIFDC